MKAKEKKIDYLLGALSPEEKAGQLLVFGFCGTFVDPQLEHCVRHWNIGGLRISPHFRKFVRYLPEGSPGIKNVVRPWELTEKMWDDDILPQHLRASEYASVLNNLRTMAQERKYGIPLHMAMDYESGSASNFMPPGLVALPSPEGLGKLGDLNLIYRGWKAVGKQMKALGIHHIQGPVVDLMRNPRAPEVADRCFGSEAQKVIDCSRQALLGLKEAGVMGTLKHFPGRGAAETDAHYGISLMDVDRDTMYRDFLAPYFTLCREKIVPVIMSAHSQYPSLDETGEIATVSRRIIGILREEIGYDGLLTTDSMSMGGLMAKYPMCEAVVRAVEAGTDIVLLKDETALRKEAYDALVQAIRSGRLSEERVARSLRRIWSAKWDLGLFENGGIVETNNLDQYLMEDQFRSLGAEAAKKCIHTLRDHKGILPLKPQQNVLVVDRVISLHQWQNDSWTYPGMFWKFMLNYSRNVSYVDYLPKNITKTQAVIEQVAPRVDIIVATAQYDRSQKMDMKSFLRDLTKFGKPVVLVCNTPSEMLVPEEMETVVLSYSLMHESLEATAAYLYGY